MAQFPDDVKVARDSLALLGYVASVEPIGRTFLTTHGIYDEVVAALQRHVADKMVAVSAEEGRAGGGIFQMAVFIFNFQMRAQDILGRSNLRIRVQYSQKRKAIFGIGEGGE